MWIGIQEPFWTLVYRYLKIILIECGEFIRFWKFFHFRKNFYPIITTFYDFRISCKVRCDFLRFLNFSQRIEMYDVDRFRFWSVLRFVILRRLEITLISNLPIIRFLSIILIDTFWIRNNLFFFKVFLSYQVNTSVKLSLWGFTKPEKTLIVINARIIWSYIQDNNYFSHTGTRENLDTPMIILLWQDSDHWIASGKTNRQQSPYHTEKFTFS